SEIGRSVVTRLMVLAHLLTYRLDVPQEGRATVTLPSAPKPLDLRLSIMPTTHGLRAAVRMPAELLQSHSLSELTLPLAVALSGHRLVSTLHASNPAGAIARLLEMGLEPYQITSALFGVVAQRLLRCKAPAGGYDGRLPVAEFVGMDQPLRQAVLNRSDAPE